MSSVLRTILVFIVLTLLFLFLGRLLGGPEGFRLALILSCIIVASFYFFSDKIVLTLFRAQKMDEAEDPEVFEMLHDLTSKTGMPIPKIYILPSVAPNAFAAGRSPHHSAIALTQGILDLLNYHELKAVLAHEIAHIEKRDTLIAGIIAVLAGAIGSLVFSAQEFSVRKKGKTSSRSRSPLTLLLMIFLMPMAASIIQLAISRSREFHADDRGAELSENPLYLASALKKLESAGAKSAMLELLPSSAHLFILNPLMGKGLMRLFNTHPLVERRIGRLEGRAREQGL